MNKRELLGVFFLFFLVTAIFFYPMFLRGHVPFPGDLLVGNYEPYKSNSYFGWGPGAVPHKAQGQDVVREAYLWKFLAVETMKNGELPWWNPYSFAGNPQLANFQTAALYPLNFLFSLLPFNLAWTIFIFLQPVLAGVFTYLFCREIKLRKMAAIFSGIIFGFSAFMAVWIEYGNMGHALLWLPLALYLTEKISKEFTWEKSLLLSLVLTTSLLAGFIQTSIYLFGTVFFYFLYRFWARKNLPHFLGFLIALSFPLILASLQLLPSLELFRLSARDPYPLDEMWRLLSPWYYSITTLVPDFFGHPATRNHWFWGTYIERVSYIGIIPLIFVLYAFFSKKKRPFWFFLSMAAVSYTLSLNILPTRLFFSLHPPLISTAVPTRVLSLFSFAAAILAGVGLENWFSERDFRKILKVVSLVIMIYVFILIFVFLAPKLFSQSEWIANLGVTKRNLVFPTFLAFTGGGLMVWASRASLKKVATFITLFLLVFDLFYFFHKITPFSPREFVFPKTEVMEFLRQNIGIDRFWGYGIASIETNFATQERVFSPEGSDALHLKRYGELIATSKEGKIPQRVPRRDANVFSGYGSDDLKNNFFRQRILNLLGVKYILNKNDNLGSEWQPDYQTFPPEKYKLVWQKGKWQVYENTQVLPRFFLTSDYVVLGNDEQIIEKIFEPNFNLKTVILEEELPAELAKTEGEVELKEYSPNRVKFLVKTGGNQLLFLSDNYYPGWQAFLDGQKTKIYRTHYSFRAVVVPPGEHQVEFIYQPKFVLWSGLSKR